MDPSVDAFASGDYTLIGSACGAVPGRGMDVCQVTQGSQISTAWTMILPPIGGKVLGGEIDVYYRTLHKQYSLTDKPILQIPWADFFGSKTWSPDQDGEVEALALIRWQDNTGVTQVTKLRGLAKIIVTSAGYDRMPIDSGFQAWTTKCTIQYSSAGRSALECK